MSSRNPLRPKLRSRITPLGLLDAAAILSVILVTLWQLHPNLVFSNTMITGGDTGSHFVLSAYLRELHNPFNVTPWYPGWFAGMPSYTYYFPLADALAAIFSYIVGFAVAFKITTILGSLLLPVTAYALGRLLKAPRPIPAALAMATLPFLFDASFTIDGGNLFSTMAGEYAYALSLALALLSIGLFARGMRTGKGYWLAGLALSATLAAHVLPWFYAIGAILVLAIMDLLPHRDPDLNPQTNPHPRKRVLRFTALAGIISFGFSAWWLLSFATTQSLSNSMNYSNDPVSTSSEVFTKLGWFNATGGAGGDRWVIILATIGFVVAFALRDRLGVLLATLSALGLLSFVYDPQSVIWNERLIPYWFISIYLLTGWLVGYTIVALMRSNLRARWRHYLEARYPQSAEPPRLATAPTPASAAQRVFAATLLIITLGLASVVPGLIPRVASVLHLNTSGNQVSSWAAWNYSGYQAKASWPEFENIVATLDTVTKKYGCGRAMWEYNSNQDRFGTPEALMTLPYWTNNCVDSMEGLLFESSATTPYHFLNQAELSLSPSDPQAGLPYGPLDVDLGVRHLQMLGVRYYIAYSPAAIQQANADPELTYLASTKHWPAPGATWNIYLVKNSAYVTPLSTLPNVVAGIDGRVTWLNANVKWYLNPSSWSVLGAATGPTNWPHVSSITKLVTRKVTPTVVSNIDMGLQSISFHVTRLNVPVVVKISYYPRWKVTGATGPYRVSPNLMVVIPTSHNVTLYYGLDTADVAGNVITSATIILGLGSGVLTYRRRKTRLTAK